MINVGKCPQCQKPIRHVKLEDVDINTERGPRWKGFSYLCPSCSCVLSVQMNPLTLNDDLKASIIEELTKH